MPAKWPDILNAIRDKLVQDKVVPTSDRVLYWSSKTDPPQLTGDKDILFRTKGYSSPQDIVQGAGRLARIYRNLEITARCRLNRDEKNRHEIWLTDDDDGMLAFELEIIDSLQMYQPQTPDLTDVLTGEPIRFLQSTDPSREIQAQATVGGWGTAAQMWQVMFEPDIDQSWQ